jgi:hypothetical protein
MPSFEGRPLASHPWGYQWLVVACDLQPETNAPSYKGAPLPQSNSPHTGRAHSSVEGPAYTDTMVHAISSLFEIASNSPCSLA